MNEDKALDGNTYKKKFNYKNQFEILSKRMKDLIIDIAKIEKEFHAGKMKKEEFDTKYFSLMEFLNKTKKDIEIMQREMQQEHINIDALLNDKSKN